MNKITIERLREQYVISESDWLGLVAGQLRIAKVTQRGISDLEVLKFSLIDPKQVPGFFRNFNRLKGIQHSAIVKHRDVYLLEESTFPFSIVEVLEHINSGTLVDFLKKGQKGYVVVKLFSQFFNALAFLHKEKLLHRDIKATNILIHISEGNPNVKLADIEFGMSNRLKTTPEFLAPEVKYFNDYNVQAEIWAIGVMIYELFTGKFPFGSRLEGLSIEQIKANMSKPLDIDINLLPYPFADITHAALQKDVSKRAKSVDELIKLLPKS